MHQVWPKKKLCRATLNAPAVIRAIAALIIAACFYGSPQANLAGNAYAAPAAPPNLERIVPDDKTPSKPAKKLWVCPMHPHVVSDHPGTCPICGMDLVEMEQTDKPHSDHGVHLNSATQQKLGVRLAAAKWQTLGQDIHAYGSVAADESLIYSVSSRIEGVIKKLHVHSAGQQVKAGQVLYEIYSPELVRMQQEFIELLKEKDRLTAKMMSEDAHISGKGMTDYEMMDLTDNTARRVAYIDKFLYIDPGKELIDEIYRTYRPRDIVEVRAAQSGIVTRIEVHEGSTVRPMDNLFSITDPSRVLIKVALYPDQLAWVKNGDEVTVNLPQPDARKIKARIQFIAPMVDSQTRTAEARMSVNNPKNLLMTGSFLDVIIHASPHKALAVPRSAVIRTGKNDLVMLAEGSGYFTPAKVETGIETTDFIEIISGLQAGNQVAVNGQFLLDAAASMSDTEQRLHGGHD